MIDLTKRELNKNVQRAVNVYRFDQLSSEAKERAIRSLQEHSTYKVTAQDDFERVMEENIACILGENEKLLAFDPDDLCYDDSTKNKFGFSDFVFYECNMKDILLTNNFSKDVIDSFDHTVFKKETRDYDTSFPSDSVYVELSDDIKVKHEKAAQFLYPMIVNELNTIIKKIKESYDETNSFYFHKHDGYVKDYLEVFECDFLADGTFIDISWDDYTEETKRKLSSITGE